MQEQPHNNSEVADNITPQVSEGINVEQSGIVTLREHAGKALEGYRSWSEQYPFAATAVETAVVFAAKRVVRYVGDKASVPVQNALEDEHIDAASRHLAQTAARVILLAPIAEELQYRGPSWLRRQIGNRKPSRILDAVMLLGFTAGHAGVIQPADWRKPPFVTVDTSKVSVPIVPLMGGANYARLSEQRGFVHGILAHVINNAMESAAATPEVRRRRAKP